MKIEKLGVHSCPVCGELIDLETEYAKTHMYSDDKHRRHLKAAQDHVRQQRNALCVFDLTDTNYVVS